MSRALEGAHERGSPKSATRTSERGLQARSHPSAQSSADGRAQARPGNLADCPKAGLPPGKRRLGSFADDSGSARTHPFRAGGAGNQKGRSALCPRIFVENP